MKQFISRSINLLNQQERNNTSLHLAAETNQFEPNVHTKPLLLNLVAESNTISIELAPHAHRPLDVHVWSLYSSCYCTLLSVSAKFESQSAESFP
jgi:hypothetical protein